MIIMSRPKEAFLNLRIWARIKYLWRPHLGNELVCTASKYNGGGLCAGTTLEEVEALAAHLYFVEPLTRTNNSRDHIVDGALHNAPSSLSCALQVALLHSTSTEYVAVREVLQGFEVK